RPSVRADRAARLLAGAGRGRVDAHAEDAHLSDGPDPRAGPRRGGRRGGGGGIDRFGGGRIHLSGHRRGGSRVRSGHRDAGTGGPDVPGAARHGPPPRPRAAGARRRRGRGLPSLRQQKRADRVPRQPGRARDPQRYGGTQAEPLDPRREPVEPSGRRSLDPLRGGDMRRLAIWIALLAVLAACSGGALSTDDTTAHAISADVGAEPARTEPMTDEDLPAGEEVSVATPESRKVIHRARISIESEDTRATERAIRDLVAEAGGFIQSAEVSDPLEPDDQPEIHMVVRIPAGDLDSALTRVGALATRVVSQSQEGRDVTEEYVDVEARIANLELLETELRELLADVRRNPEADPQKLLQVFNEISRVRGE